MTSTQPWVWKLVGLQQAPGLVRKPSQWGWHGVGPHRRDPKAPGTWGSAQGPSPLQASCSGPAQPGLGTAEVRGAGRRPENPSGLCRRDDEGPEGAGTWVRPERPSRDPRWKAQGP